MKRLASSAILGILLLSASAVSAAQFAQNEERLVISVPVRDDLYVAGGNVETTAEVEGDLIVGAGNVTIAAPVRADLAAAAGNIRVAGTVGDDARIAAGTVIVTGQISDDLVVTGGQISLDAGSRVGGDLVVMGGDVTVRGTVEGNVKIFAGNVYFEGVANGDFEARAEKVDFGGRVSGNALIVSEKLTAAEGSAIGGGVRYWREDGEMSFPSVGGETVYDPSLVPDSPEPEVAVGIAAFVSGWLIYTALASILFILLLTLATRRIFVEAGTYLRKFPGFSFLWGILYVLLMPVLALLLFVTVIGIPLGFFVLVTYLFTFLFLTPLSAMVFARYLEGYGKKKWNKPAFFAASVGVYVVLKVVGLVPVVGWIVKAVALVFALGALLWVKYDKFRKYA